MFDTVREFVKLLREGKIAGEPNANDPDVAAVALFYHVIGADGVVSESEAQRLKSLIVSDYGRSGDDLTTLLDAGRKADMESVDLFSFTSILNRHLDEAGKTHFVELLWELAYADGMRHELEEHVVWRIADLLGVAGRDRIMARQRVASRAGSLSKEPNASTEIDVDEE